MPSTHSLLTLFSLCFLSGVVAVQLPPLQVLVVVLHAIMVLAAFPVAEVVGTAAYNKTILWFGPDAETQSPRISEKWFVYGLIGLTAGWLNFNGFIWSGLFNGNTVTNPYIALALLVATNAGALWVAKYTIGYIQHHNTSKHNI